MHAETPVRRHQWLSLVICIAICLAVMLSGALTTAPAIADWYAGLRKPAWTPPDWLFGPVWTALYLSMAVAAWLVWRRRHETHVAWPLGLFTVQLFLNAAWSPLFFGLRYPAAAFVDIVLLWGSIAATLAAFWRVRAIAGVLLVPYLVWVTYAAGLNFTIWRLNG
jgi:benzodiazapine receptor